MRPEDFDFASGPVAGELERHQKNKRLMVVDRMDGSIRHQTMADLERYIEPDEQVWANNSFNIQLPDPTYHPCYAAIPGSHATPTAGLFIAPEQAERLKIRLLTLHIGGPSQQRDVLEGYRTNVGWREWYRVPEPPAGKVFAIGTTVVKALETWARTGRLEGWSTLFIQPPFTFKVVGKLLTNFHFAREPLLALTSAFGGIDLMREAYEQAVIEKYRFSDYGDRLLVI